MRRVLLAPLVVALCAAPAIAVPGAHDSTIRLGGAPTALAVGAGSVWVLVGNGERAWLLRLAPEDGRQRARVELGRYVEDNGGVTVGAGAVWVAAGAWLVRVDPAGDRVVRRIRVGSTAISVFATSSAIWVTRAAGRRGELVRVDPTTNRVVTRTTMGGGPESVVQALGSLWVVNTSPPSLMRVDPSNNDVAATLLGDAPLSSLATARGRLWIAEGLAVPPVLLGLDGRGRIVRRIRLPREVAGLAARGNQLWATASGRLLRIDLRLGRLVASYRIGEIPVAVAVGGGAAWVANFSDATVSRIPS